MIIDGRAIAREIQEKIERNIAGLATPPVLAIIIVGDDPVIESFVRIKKRIGGEVGALVHEHRFGATCTTEEIISKIKNLAEDKNIDGIIVQLPLPAHIDTQKVLDAVPTEKDIDMLAINSVAAFKRGDAPILPPVAGAIQEILERSQVKVSGVDAMVLGYGKLVGVPAALLLRHNGAHVTVVDKPMRDLGEHLRDSDIVVCGVGKPSFVTPDMLKKGVVLIDAGTSEAGGKLVGDADPRCAEVASVFTPVPCGVGPITVALIFKNLLILSRAKNTM